MWQSLGIAKKICVSVAIIVLGYSIAMVFVITQGTLSQRRMAKVESAIFPASQQSQAALTAFEQEVKAYGDAVIMGDNKGLETARVMDEAAQSSLTSISQKSGLSPEIITTVRDCLGKLNQYSSTARPLYATMTGGRMDKMEEAMALGKDAAALKEDLEALNRTLSSDLHAELSSEARGSGNQVTASAAALLWVLITSGLLIYITTVIVRPLARITEVANRISAGDVNQTISHRSRDEVGMLAEAFRAMIAYIKGIADAADLLSKGQSGVRIEARSDQDLLSRNFGRVAETLRLMSTETARLTEAVGQGRLEVRGDTRKLQGTFAEIIHGFNKTLDAIVAPINEAAKVLQKMAKKDLTHRMTGTYQGDFARIKEGLNLALEILESSLQQVSAGSAQVAYAAEQISAGSQSLARGSSEQAGSLQELSANLEETAAMARQNASSAQKTRGVAEQARRDAAVGAENMKRLSEAIQKIKQSADQSAKIVKTINEIAFQTNLLALNAAVEAARAGDLGKGFAIVAEEVRNLAMRSSRAAGNTGSLIEESVRDSDNGVVLNQEVLANLEVINHQINSVTTVISEIAAASDQQKAGLDRISSTVNQMNQLTQEVAASAEESASSAKEMTAQAAEMQEMVRGFTLRNSDAACAAG